MRNIALLSLSLSSAACAREGNNAHHVHKEEMNTIVQHWARTEGKDSAPLSKDIMQLIEAYVSRCDWSPPFQVAENVYPFSPHVYHWNSYHLHYVDQQPTEAAKGTVIAIHGNATWGIIYRKIINPLVEKGFRVIVPDLFGFGLSDKPPVEVFDYMPHSHAKVMGDFFKATAGSDNLYLALHDWGGPIGLEVATKMPKKIDGILLMNTWAWELPDYPETKANPYHVVHDRGVDARTNTKLYLSGHLIWGGGFGLAKKNAAEGSKKYIDLQKAQWGPFFKLDPQKTYSRKEPSELISKTAAVPFHVFAKATVEDAKFLRELDKNMKPLYTKPLYLMFGDDTAFGPLKVNLGNFSNNQMCPDGYECEKLTDSKNGKLDMYTNAVSKSDGNKMWPYVQKFSTDWNKSKIVGVWKSTDHGHWVQDEAPSVAIGAIEKLYEHNKRESDHPLKLSK